MAAILGVLLILDLSCKQPLKQKSHSTKTKIDMSYKIQKTELEWKSQLTPEQYHVLREKGTEYPNTGIYNLHFEKGIYHCAGCGLILFKSEHKYQSHCGWPAFDKEIQGNISYKKDTIHGMIRTEILCANCGGHLGHVFDDGPQQTTGKRYCVNSLSLDFQKT